MRIGGTPDQVVDYVAARYPEVRTVMEACAAQFPLKHRTISHYQAAPLYMLTKELSPEFIFEIGTFHGFSAGIMANAAPNARIVTCNPKTWEAEVARNCLQPYPHVELVEAKSWDLLGQYSGMDMIFVDGDHKNVVRDLPWWNALKVGGFMFFHDYTPADATSRPCPPVYEALNDFAIYLKRPEPDVIVVDDGKLGMAGFYRTSSDPNVEVRPCKWEIAPNDK